MAALGLGSLLFAALRGRGVKYQLLCDFRMVTIPHYRAVETCGAGGLHGDTGAGDGGHQGGVPPC